MQQVTYEEGMALLNTHTCAECGTLLTLAWGGSRGINGYILFCGDNPDHQGFVKQGSLTQAYQEGESVPIEIANQIERSLKKQMKEELGEEKTTALEPYRGVTALTKAQASLVLSTIWPEAPLVEVEKAAWVCASYGLNPLMRHVFLIPFKRRDRQGKETGDVDWSIVIGIKANRLIASRNRPYGYVDGPRIMTRDEQETLLGEVDPTRIWALTTIKDESGNQATGYGNWPKSDEPKGVNKGNSKANMAHIRSERAALDRLCPGEMPEGVDVVDEAFIEGDYKVVNEKTGEIIDVPGVRIIEDEDIAEASRFDDLLIACPIHGDPWKIDNYGKLSHSHEGGWCKASPIIFEIFAKEAKRVGFVSEPDEKWKLDDYLKARFGGRTWSKMSPTEQVNACKLMERTEQRPEGGTVVPPLEDEPPVDVEPSEEGQGTLID